MKNRDELAQAIVDRMKHERNVPVSIRLTQDEYDFVNGLAEQTGGNISKVIHTLIQEYMGE